MKVTNKVVIDGTTGDILEDTTTIVNVKKIDSDSFVSVYLNDMSGIMNVKNQTELRVLYYMWKESTFPNDKVPGNRIVISGCFFDDVEEGVGICRQSIRNCISSLSKSGVIIKDRKNRSTYYLNPKYFFKGRLEDLPRVRRVMLEYEIVD